MEVKITVTCGDMIQAAKKLDDLGIAHSTEEQDHKIQYLAAQAIALHRMVIERDELISRLS